MGLWVTNEQRRTVHKSLFYLFAVEGSLGSTLLLFIICDVYSIVAQLVTDQNCTITWVITITSENESTEKFQALTISEIVFFLYAGSFSVMSYLVS